MHYPQMSGWAALRSLAGAFSRLIRPRRLLRVGGAIVGALAAVQLAIVGALMLVERQRKHRAPVSGFPHLDTAAVSVVGNDIQVYSYGRTLYDAMLAAIDSAQESIYLETFIWKADEVGQEFKEHLIAKARQGIQVYVIFDNFGNLVVPDAFKAFPATIHVMKFSAIRRPWHALDPRRYALDHRKLLVVDGRMAFIGGYNIGSLYATQWRDTHLRLTGPDAEELAYSFLDFWNRFSTRNERVIKHYPRRFEPTIEVHGNDALRLTFPIRNMYIDVIDRAQSHIYLTNAYFIPDHTVLEALIAAARRGVDVQVLLPLTSNHIVADWVSRAYFTTCLRGGVRLFGFKDAMIHAKTCTIDGQWSTIGTANLDRLSSVGNFEINLEVYDERLAQQMDALFESDKTNAVEITAERWISRRWYIKLSEFLLAPLRFML